MQKNHAPTPYSTFDPEAPIAVVSAGLSGLVTNTEIDHGVKELIRAHNEGYFTEKETRGAIAGVLALNPIVDETIVRIGASTLIYEDVRDQVVEKITDLVLGDNSTFDLEIQATASAAGWLRMKCGWLTQSYRRDVRRERARNGYVADHETLETYGASFYDEDDEDEKNRRQRAIDEYATQCHGLRGKPRNRLRVEQLMDLYGVPMALRPENHHDRDEMMASLASDPGVAYRSIETFAAYILGVNATDPGVLTRDIDDRFLGLWDDYEPTHIEALLNAPPDATLAIARYAVEPWVRPAKKAISKMRAAVARQVPGDLKWRRLSSGLVESWIDTECAPSNDFSPVMSEERVEATNKGYTVSRSRWGRFVADAVSYEGAPLGDTEGKVRESLMVFAMKHLESRDFEKVKQTRAAKAVETVGVDAP